MKEEQLEKVVEQVTKAFAENNLSVLMIVGDKEEGKIKASRYLKGDVDILVSMVAEFLDKDYEFLGFIREASERCLKRQLSRQRESHANRMEDFFRELLNHKHTRCWIYPEDK